MAVDDEMLAYREVLDAGTPLRYAVPKPRDDGVVWSGLRLRDRVVVRTFKQGGGQDKVTIEPWSGKSVKLEATPHGRTDRLKRAGDNVLIEK